MPSKTIEFARKFSIDYYKLLINKRIDCIEYLLGIYSIELYSTLLNKNQFPIYAYYIVSVFSSLFFVSFSAACEIHQREVRAMIWVVWPAHRRHRAINAMPNIPFWLIRITIQLSSPPPIYRKWLIHMNGNSRIYRENGKSAKIRHHQ